MDDQEIYNIAKIFGLTLAPDWMKLSGPEEDAFFLGPALLDDVLVVSTEDGADVFYQDKKMFTVNQEGKRLLEMADGRTSMNRIVQKLDLTRNASDAALFYVYLGTTGYLKNRVKVRLFESTELYNGKDWVRQ